MANRRVLIFVFASFVSAVGDALLVFSVPAGFGLETNDIRSAVLMWMVPAVAMFLSSFLNGKISQRRHSARRDYGLLLLVVAGLEIVIAIAALNLNGQLETMLLVTAFVFIYALAKEGIPRLLYSVSVYRYFADSQFYSKVAGLVSGATILAAFAGTALSSPIVQSGNWRYALIIDAATFVLLAAVILVCGKDVPADESSAEGSSSETLKFEESLKTILLVVPGLFAVNALVWNYLPILSQQRGVMTASVSILAISLLRLPGMISGFFTSRIFARITPASIVIVLPIAYFVFSFVFVFSPGLPAFCFLTVANGLITGLYWPADFTLRNRLSHRTLVSFNTAVLRRLAVFQFAACCLAMFVYGPVDRNGPVQVLLPSLNRSFELNSGLTYAAMIVLNDTSARFLRIASDLTLKGEVLKRYEMLEGGREYILTLDEAYRSARGETVTAEDVAYTIRHFLSTNSELAGPYKQIDGSDLCSDANCLISGLRILGKGQVAVRLRSVDLHFIDRLSSPWMILFKKGRPLYEQVGSCSIPYQLGAAIVIKCDDDGIEMKFGARSVYLSDKKGALASGAYKELVTSNPRIVFVPTLTVMSIFANPKSSVLDGSKRIAVMSALRARADDLSERLRLKRSALMTPHWLSVQTPADFNSAHTPDRVVCPGVPIKVLLDSSLPDLNTLRSYVQTAIPCEITFSLTNADQYFKDFESQDLGFCWFTPDTLDVYNGFSSLDCSTDGNCYFNWHDKQLQKQIDRVRKASRSGFQDKDAAIDVERIVARRGYVVPLVEMNWWIKNGSEYKSIHPAGLFQVGARDFL